MSEERSADKAIATDEQAKQYYNQKAHHLKNIDVGSHVAIQNPETKLWDICGIVSEIGPHRKYYIRTAGRAGANPKPMVHSEAN